MSETWKQWQGQSVNGEFPLLAYLGGSRHSAVFVTRRKSAPERAAIKLVRADDSGAESQLHRWKKSAELNHPNMVRIFESGRCEIENTSLLFVVMEIAEEDLSQILPERALAPEEVRQMLPPVLDALDHLHGKGLVHGRVRPSNIQASGDQVKVSADTVRVSGERVPAPDVWSANDPPEGSGDRLTAASDVWSLAITLVQVLTQQRPMWHPSEPASPSLPETTPEPFGEIARRCLQVDPAQRCTVAEIRTALQPKSSKTVSSPQSQSSLRREREKEKESKGAVRKSIPRGWILGIALAALVLVVIVLAMSRHAAPVSPASEAQPQPVATANGVPQQAPNAAETAPSLPRTPKGTSRRSADQPAMATGAKGAVTHEALPQVSSGARRTIQGTIKVVVRVDVDASGNVTAAKLANAGPSKYFARLALDAAHDWKFTPPQPAGRAAASQWNLRFGFRRTGTEVSPIQIAP
jgi:TonB family protein